MTYAEKEARSISKAFHKAFDKSLQLQTKIDGLDHKHPKYWHFIDQWVRIQYKCRQLDKKLSQHLLTIKPNIYEQVRNKISI